MVAAWRIAGFRPAAGPVTAPVTKFGGRPVWVREPQWPLGAAWGTPMRFVCQIALEPDLAGPGPARLAYVFVTHGDHGRDADDFDPDVIDPDGGENAVVVQPGDFADALGVGEFAVYGHSGGGPCALACAALLPGRVTAAVAVSSLAPYPADGLDWFAGMAPDCAATLRAAAAGRAAKEAHVAGWDRLGQSARARRCDCGTAPHPSAYRM